MTWLIATFVIGGLGFVLWVAFRQGKDKAQQDEHEALMGAFRRSKEIDVEITQDNAKDRLRKDAR